MSAHHEQTASPVAKPPTTLPPLGLALLVGLTLGWGLTWPVMKIGVADVPPVTFRALTTPLGALAMVLVMIASRVPLRLPEGRWGVLALASSLNMMAWFLLMSFGVLLLDSGEAAILAYTMPLWAAILGALILKERLTGRQAAALAVGLAGIALLLTDQLSAVRASPLGTGVMLLAAFFWATGTIVQKRVQWRMPILAVTTWQLLIATPPMAVIPFLFPPAAPAAFSTGAIFAIGWTALIAHAFCFTAWFKIISLVPATVSALSVLIIPAVGVISGALILGEVVGGREWAALALVSGAVGLTLTGGTRR